MEGTPPNSAVVLYNLVNLVEGAIAAGDGNKDDNDLLQSIIKQLVKKKAAEDPIYNTIISHINEKIGKFKKKEIKLRPLLTNINSMIVGQLVAEEPIMDIRGRRAAAVAERAATLNAAAERVEFHDFEDPFFTTIISYINEEIDKFESKKNYDTLTEMLSNIKTTIIQTEKDISHLFRPTLKGGVLNKNYKKSKRLNKKSNKRSKRLNKRSKRLNKRSKN